MGGICLTQIDAFYAEMFVCTILGILWICYFRKIMFNLQSLPKKEWQLDKSLLKAAKLK
jgi:hypothetical protein